MRMLFALIGYVSTATLIAAALGLGLMWRSGQLDDEKMFRIVAIVHDIDFDAASKNVAQDEEIPKEEPSLADLARSRELMSRDAELKLEALRRGRQEFDHRLQLLTEATKRFDEVAQKVRSELEQTGELSNKENIGKVVRNLESVVPEVAKNLLMQNLDGENGMNDVITLMNTMNPSKLKKVLQSFQSEKELEDLHAIHQVLLRGGPKAAILEQALSEVQSLETSGP